MDNEQRELVALTEKWMVEIKNLAIDYTKAINKLDDIRKKYEESWFERLHKLSPVILVILQIVGFVGLVLVLNFSHFQSVEFLGIKIIKSSPIIK